MLKEGRTILKEKDDMIEQMSKEQRTEIVAVVRECTAILTTVSDFLDRYERHFDQHTIELERSKEKNMNRTVSQFFIGRKTVSVSPVERGFFIHRT